jgi:hypothetical protein
MKKAAIYASVKDRDAAIDEAPKTANAGDANH